MSDRRNDRSHDNRNLSERPKKWSVPSILPEPIKEEGMAYRWIRISMLNEPDPRNISMKLREGWEPVKAIEQSHMKVLSVASSNSQYAGCIEMGGLLLCKTPMELVIQRDEHFLNQANNQMESVDNSFMRESDPRAPLFKDHKTTVSFGKGK